MTPGFTAGTGRLTEPLWQKKKQKQRLKRHATGLPRKFLLIRRRGIPRITRVSPIREYQDKPYKNDQYDHRQDVCICGVGDAKARLRLARTAKKDLGHRRQFQISEEKPSRSHKQGGNYAFAPQKTSPEGLNIKRQGQQRLILPHILYCRCSLSAALMPPAPGP